MNMPAFLSPRARLALLALSSLALVALATPSSGAQSVGNCDADPIVCAVVIHDDCFRHPVQSCFREPVPACLYYELHPPPPLPGWGAGIYCWLS